MEFNSQTAVAIGRLIITIVASVAATFGWAFDAELWLNIVISLIAIVLLVYSWWKNENITHAAQEAQKVLDTIKDTESMTGSTIDVNVQKLYEISQKRDTETEEE